MSVNVLIDLLMPAAEDLDDAGAGVFATLPKLRLP
jgi:hypothetical protein